MFPYLLNCIALPNNDGEWNEWEYIISGLVNENIWVTLDYDLKYHQEVLEEGWNEKDTFISMISVKMQLYVRQLNYNACIKIDDIGFKETNWCMGCTVITNKR